MLRRSRISVRPNVRPNPSAAGRSVPAQPVSQDAPVSQPVSQDAPGPQPVSNDAPGPLPISQEIPQREINEDHSVAVVTDGSPVSPLRKSTVPRDTSDAGGEGTSPAAALQRRKRFSIKPKVAPALNRARAPKSPVRTAVLESPAVEGPCADSQDVTASSQTDATLSQGTTSPSQQRMLSGGLSGGDTRPTTPLVPAEDDNSTERAQVPLEKSQPLELSPISQSKDVPPKPPDKPCLSDKEAMEMSEKAKTLVSRSAKGGPPPPQDQFTLSRLLNDSSDLQRLEKARKLRELLRKEMNKDKVKKHMKNTTSKARVKEYTPDPAKMTMRDLIYYLPVSNPMSSYLADSQAKNDEEIVVPPSPARQPSPERVPTPPPPPSPAPSSRHGGEDDGDDEQEEEDCEADDDQLMVPRVKVAEDGSLIIDEASLTVEVKRAKGPNPADGKDPIFERGSTTTYSSFRKGNYTKPWSTEETEMFFLAISMVGTDFSMICQLFPHRARSQIKHKFKREERGNSWRVDKAFKERRKLDIEFFSKLLEKILEVQKCKKPRAPRERKPKSPGEKKTTTRKPSRKTKGKTAETILSDVEEEEEEEEELDGGADMEEVEGEKENEDVSNERGAPASPQRSGKRKKKDNDESTEKPSEKKKKTKKKKTDEEQSSEQQVEPCLPETGDAAALPEDQSSMDSSSKTESVTAAVKSAVIKPAQLSRGRAAKPLIPLGRKWGKKGPTPSTKDPAAGGKSSADDKVDEESSPLRPTEDNKQDGDNSCEGEEDDSTVSPPKRTRYGRLPKPVQHLNYSAKEDAALSSASDGPTAESASKPKRLVKKAKAKAKSRPKKPQLVTLRASQSEGSDDDDDNDYDNDHCLSEVDEMDQQHHSSSPRKDSSAPVFVPVGLRSPQPVVSVLEETMEELDFSVNVPDVLGFSQGALCSDASCERAQDSTGTVPCDHQLDLLVDVIDLMSCDQVEVSSDESYNEAAQTLLTIGAVAHHSQLAQPPTSPQSHTAGGPFSHGNETSSHDLEEMPTETVPHIQSGGSPETVAHIQSGGSPETVAHIQSGGSPETVAHIQSSGSPETVAHIQSSGSPVAAAPSGPASTEPSQTTDEDVPDTSIIDLFSEIDDGINEEAGEGTHRGRQMNADAVEAAPAVETCQEMSEQNSPPAKRRRLPKAKPKPNLGRAARFAQSQSTQIEETATVPVTQMQRDAAPVAAVLSCPVYTESSPPATDMNEPDKPMESSSVTVSSELSTVSVSTLSDVVPAPLAEPSTETVLSEDESVSQRNTANIGPGLQMELDTDISEQHSPQNKGGSFSKVEHESILGEAIRKSITKSDSHSSEAALTSTEDSCTAHVQDETITSGIAATDAQDEARTIAVIKESALDTRQDISDCPATVSSIGSLSDSHGSRNEAGFASQNKNSCFSEDKSGMLPPQTTEDKHLESTEDNNGDLESSGSTLCTTSTPHSTKDTATQLEPQPVDNTHQKLPQSTKIIEPNAFESASAVSHSLAEICTSEEKKTEVKPTCQGESSSDSGSKQTVPQQRRSRFPKLKPNIGIPTRKTQSRLELPGETNKQSEKECMVSSSNVCLEKQPVEHLKPPQSSSNTVDHRPESPRATRSEMLLEKSDTDVVTVSKSFGVIDEPFTVTGNAPESQKGHKVISKGPQRMDSTPDKRNATDMVSASHLLSVAEKDIPQRGRVARVARVTKPVVNTHQKSPQSTKIIEPNAFESASAVSHSLAEICTSEEKKTHVKPTCQGDSSSDSGSKQTVPQQRRPRFPKVKPNIGIPTRKTQSRLELPGEINKQSEKECMVSNVGSEKQPVEHLKPPQSSSNTVDHRPQSPRATRSEMLLEKSDTDVEMVNETFWVIDEPFTVTGNLPETQNSDKVTSEEPQRKDSTPDERNATDMFSASHLLSVAEKESPQRRGRVTKVKPNVRQATRATRSKPQLPVQTLSCSESDGLATGTGIKPTQDLDIRSDVRILEDSSKDTSSQQSLSIPIHSGSIKELFSAMPSSPLETLGSSSLAADVLNEDDVIVDETSWIIENPFEGTDCVPEPQITDMPTSKPLPAEEPSTSQHKMVPTSEPLATEEPCTSQLKIKRKSLPKRGGRVTQGRKGKVSEPQPTEDATTTGIAPPEEEDAKEENKVVEELRETVSKTSVNPRRGTRASRSKPQPTETICAGSEPETVGEASLPTVRSTNSAPTKQAHRSIMQSSPPRSAQHSKHQNPVTGEIGGEIMTSPEYTIDSEVAWLIEDPFSISNTEAIESTTEPAAPSTSLAIEAGSVPQSGFNPRPSTEAKELKPQDRTDAASTSELQSAEDASARSKRGRGQTTRASIKREPTQVNPDRHPWTDVIHVSDSDHTVVQEGLSESCTQHVDDASSGTCEREKTSTKAETVWKRTRTAHSTTDKTSVNPRRGTRASRSKPQPTETICAGSEPETVGEASLPTVGTNSTPTKRAHSSIMQSSPSRSAQHSKHQNPVTGEIAGEIMTSPEYTIDSEVAWLIEDPFSISNTEAIESTTEPAAPSTSLAIEAGSVPQSGFNPRPSTEAKELKPQDRTDAASTSELQSAEDASARSKRGRGQTTRASIKREPTQVDPDPHPWTDVIHVSDSDHTVVQEGLSESCTSEPTAKHGLQDLQQADGASSGTCEREKTSAKAPHTRRARLPKPKPCLGNGSRRTRTPSVQQPTQPTTAASSSGQKAAVSAGAVDALEHLKPCPDNQPPVEGATVEEYKQGSPSSQTVCSTVAGTTRTPVISTVCTLASPTRPRISAVCTLASLNRPVISAACSLASPTPPVISAVCTLASPTRPRISAVCSLASPTQRPVISGVCSLASPTQRPAMSVLSDPEEHSLPATATELTMLYLPLFSGFLPQSRPEDTGAASGQSYPAVTAHQPEGLLEQVPSDNEEPFFILSLTEVPYVHDSQSSGGFPSSGDSLTLCDVPVPVSGGEAGPDGTCQTYYDPTPGPEPACPPGPEPACPPGPACPPEPEPACPPAQPQTMQPSAARDTLRESSHIEVEQKDLGFVGHSSSALELPPDTSNTLKRPGRKPKGFLSFLSDKSSASSPSRPARAPSQAPQLGASRPGRRRAAPPTASETTTIPARVDEKPSTSTAPPNPTARRAGKDSKRSCRDTSQMDPGPGPSTSRYPEPEPSTSQYPDLEPCTSGTVDRTANVSLHTTRPTAPLQLIQSTVDDGSRSMLEEEHQDLGEDVEEEPTNVTQFFLNDIFTDMDEQ